MQTPRQNPPRSVPPQPRHKRALSAENIPIKPARASLFLSLFLCFFRSFSAHAPRVARLGRRENELGKEKPLNRRSKCGRAHLLGRDTSGSDGPSGGANSPCWQERHPVTARAWLDGAETRGVVSRRASYDSCKR